MPIGQGTQRKQRLYYGWVIVVVSALIWFTHSTETFGVFSVFLKPMTDTFGWSRTAFTIPISIGSLLGGLIAVGIGPVLDRHGPRWILTLALGIVGGTLVLMARMTTLWQYIVIQTLGRMVAGGIISVASTAVIPKWFVAKRGRAMGLTSLGGRIGSTVTPLYVQLLASLASWRAGIAATGLVMWVFAMVPAAIFLRRQPEDMRLLPDGVTPEQMEQRRAQSPRSVHQSYRRAETSFTRSQALRLPSFYALTTAVALVWVARTGFSLHMMAYLIDRGLDPLMAVAVVSLHAGSGALGGVLAGLLADRFGARPVMTVMSFLVAIAFLLVLPLQSPLPFFVWGFSYGLVHSGLITLQNIIFADYYGRQHIGAIQGISHGVQTGAQAVGPLAAALAYDHTGSYTLVFIVFGLCVLASGLCVFLARPPTPPRPLAAPAEVQSPRRISP